MEKQISQALAQVRTKKKVFLEQIEWIILWGEWEKIIRPCCYKGERGNKPCELGLMLRLHILQNPYNMSDEGTATEVIESRVFGVLRCGQQQRGLILEKGTIVDSTLISALSSTKNREKKRDPEAHSVKKGTTWHFGYKAHVGGDRDTGLVHHVEVTSANVNDVTMAAKSLTGEEETVYGDSGYPGAEKREDAIQRNRKGKRIRYKINRKPSQIRKNSARSRGQIRRREREESSARAKVEHIFAVVKGIFHFRKTRYRRLANLFQVHKRRKPA